MVNGFLFWNLKNSLLTIFIAFTLLLGGVTGATTDGTAVTFIESDLQLALQAAWTDGGDPSVILMSATNKNRFNTFAGKKAANDGKFAMYA